jgi:hypothetical protein
LVEGCQRILHGALLSLLAGQWHFAARLLHRGRCSGSALDRGGAAHLRRIVVGGARGQEGGAASAEGQQSCRGLGWPEISSGVTAAFERAATHLAEPLRLRTVLSTAYWRRVSRSVSGVGVERRAWGGVWEDDEVNDRYSAFAKRRLASRF